MQADRPIRWRFLAEMLFMQSKSILLPSPIMVHGAVEGGVRLLWRFALTNAGQNIIVPAPFSRLKYK